MLSVCAPCQLSFSFMGADFAREKEKAICPLCGKELAKTYSLMRHMNSQVPGSFKRPEIRAMRLKEGK